MDPDFQAGQGHERLERGPGRLLRLDGFVQQRVVGIVGNFLPVLGLDAHGKLVGIESRAGSPWPALRRCADRAPPRRRLVVNPILSPFHGQFRHRLKIQVDGQLQVLARNGRLFVLRVSRTCPRLSTTTCRCAVHAGQQSLYSRSMPNLPITSPGSYLANSGGVQFLLADFTRVADDVRHHAVLRIQPALRLNTVHLREEVAVRIDESTGRRGSALP